MREVNTLANIRPSKKDKPMIRFFFLLRDDLFISKDRTKFFDYIMVFFRHSCLAFLLLPYNLLYELAPIRWMWYNIQVNRFEWILLVYISAIVVAAMVADFYFSWLSPVSESKPNNGTSNADIGWWYSFRRRSDKSPSIPLYQVSNKSFCITPSQYKPYILFHWCDRNGYHYPG